MAIEKVLEKLSHDSQSAVQHLRVRSALNPILLLCLISTPVLVFAASRFSEPIIKGCLLFFALLPILVACGVFVYFAISKPEKLQSEEYQIRHEAIQVLQVKTSAIDVAPASLNVIAGMIREIENSGESKS